MSIENLIKLVCQILDIAKIRNGKMRIENYLFDIQHNMRYIYNLLHLDADAKGLVFLLNIDKKVPKLLNGDSLRLNQILINLISNAIKFTHKGSVTCDITLFEEKETERVIQFSIKYT